MEHASVSRADVQEMAHRTVLNLVKSLALEWEKSEKRVFTKDLVGRSDKR